MYRVRTKRSLKVVKDELCKEVAWQPESSSSKINTCSCLPEKLINLDAKWSDLSVGRLLMSGSQNFKEGLRGA